MAIKSLRDFKGTKYRPWFHTKMSEDEQHRLFGCEDVDAFVAYQTGFIGSLEKLIEVLEDNAKIAEQCGFDMTYHFPQNRANYAKAILQKIKEVEERSNNEHCRCGEILFLEDELKIRKCYACQIEKSRLRITQQFIPAGR